ncbi:MMPL family transporter [Spiractinospora alimapuensis]|uniref:MMPL family transporter n=1 Tax=Spiractinospora alimapuensis TaxID=2820884 RepID=UPI001F48C0F3|nr:MMPL family transporter [Spiractinospora alimapuensis]
MRSRTLRGRMVMVNAMLMIIVLVVVVTLSGTFLRSYLIDRIDDGIELAAEFLRTHQHDILAEPPDSLVEQVRAPNDFVAEYTVGTPPDAPIHRLHGEGPTLLRDIDVDSAPDEVFTVEREGEEYRVVVVELPAHDAVVLIGEPLSSVDATVKRLILIEVVVGALAVAIALAAGSAVVRRGLRPLDDVVEMAEGVAAGDLDRRVPESAADDVSEVRRLMMSINRMLEHLRGALHARARSEGELRRFVSDASHELRTPLTSIRGYLQMISQGVVDVRERPDVITRSQGESERMAAIVDDLLTLARLDERPEPRREVVELGAIVEDAVADARAAQPERDWTARVEARGLVLGDEHELRRAVANLLANVRTHTPPSSPAVARVRREDGHVLVEVDDAGPGIPEESTAFVFERFFSAGAAAAPKRSGLGLSIVRAIMHGHGGEAEFSSSETDGTRVTLRFPPMAEHGVTRAEGDNPLITPGPFTSDSHLPRHGRSSTAGALSGDTSPGRRGMPSMADLLYRLGGFSFRRRGLVAVTWLVVLVVLGGAALQFRGPISDGFTIPNTESEQATDLLEARFDTTGDAVTTVLRAPDGADVTQDESYADAVRDTAEELEDVPGVDMVVSPHSILEEAREQYDTEVADAEDQAREGAAEALEAMVPAETPNRDDVIAEQLPAAEEAALEEVADEIPAFDAEDVLGELPMLNEDRDTVMLQVQLETRAGEAAPETVDAIVDSGDSARDAGMDVEHSGQAITQTPPELGHSEIVGVLAALLVLLVNFGVVVAAGLPILMALVGVGVGMALLFAISSLMPLDSTAPMLAIMLGIAVGIDYSLFVLSRHRKQLSEGMSVEESAARAIGTAGSAVVFAGVTVMIALLGLAIVRIPFLTVMGVAAMVTVAIAVLVAITLLPALLGFLGHRVTAGRVPVLGRRAEAALRTTNTFSARWVRGVTRHPILAIVGVVIALGAALLPLSGMHLGLPTDETSPEDTTQRQAHEIISEEFGEGHSAQLAVVADLTAIPDMPAAAEEVAEHIEDVDGIAEVLPPQLNDVDDTAIITVIPDSGPSDIATEDVLHDVRDLRDEIDEDTGAQIYVAGATAASIDVSERLADALPVFATVVVGLALLLMTLVFRSILVPVKAALGFVLSAGAALGLTVVVFQWGYGASLFSVEPGPLLAFMPTLMIGILFGLAMDYEVFLVSRMREDFVHGLEPRAAITSGFTHGARVVTAAAVIMITVFASFIFGGIAMIKPIAFVLAVGVAFDAFLIRMTLGPAVMALFGRYAWWLPGWLDRLLPNIDIEGEQLARTRPTTGSATTTDPATTPAGGRDTVGTAASP